MRRNLFIILCFNYAEAERLFKIFLEFLDNNEPQFVRTVCPWSLCVQMVDDTSYVFIDHTCSDWFEGFQENFMDADDFFYGIDEYYAAEGEYIRDVFEGYYKRTSISEMYLRKTALENGGIKNDR